MAQTTTTIFLLATFLIAATTVSGEGPIAPSPFVHEGMNCVQGLAVCGPVVSQKGPPSPECCTALGTAVKTQLPCLCGLLKNPDLPAHVNVTEFSSLISQTCGLTIGPNLCSETKAPAPMPHSKAPAPGPPGSHKNAAGKLELTYLVGIVVITISAMFY